MASRRAHAGDAHERTKRECARARAAQALEGSLDGNFALRRDAACVHALRFI